MDKFDGVLTGLRVDELDQASSVSDSEGESGHVSGSGQVNSSVAIIPMSHQFGWSSSVAGLVQSSFFWGYALSQLPGGWLAKVFGGRASKKLIRRV
ncbi:hypothetical protein LWI28_016969 [Acer negundo]|uniref:Major facilitator superfamily (MFS) profile domain-containing protein n=1 Tax=Acer negundo TaxID=4023 RepID=A0AAD5NY49_ACENE|nr:hypothetical protein LWI28_016969 [Acer negundo]